MQDIIYRFLNDRREKVRSDNPNLTFTEITKLLASEWSKLPADQKQVCRALKKIMFIVAS